MAGPTAFDEFGAEMKLAILAAGMEQGKGDMNFIDGTIPAWGTHDDNTHEQIRNCARTADRVALMADGHFGYAVPIGGVVAYENAISPSGVGYDIGCGNKAVCAWICRAPTCAETRPN